MSFLFNTLFWQSAKQPKAIVKPPTLEIYQQPTGFSGLVGADFQINLLSNGTNYAFFKDTSATPLVQNTTGTLAFQDVVVTDSGKYYCIISDNFGQSLKSTVVEVIITEIAVDPDPDPTPNPQPISGTVIRVNNIGNNTTYNNSALAGKNYLLFRNGYQRFLFPFEYDVLSTGGFELHSPLITGDCIILMALDDNIIELKKLTENKVYNDTSLAGKNYAVYRNGYRRLLDAHELNIKNSGGFDLHSPIITGDSVIVFVGAAILNNLNHNSRYIDTGLQNLNYVLYRDGLGRFLNDNEFDKLTEGGFILHSPLTFNERLLVFKL
jgi:hypothetical protein